MLAALAEPAAFTSLTDAAAALTLAAVSERPAAFLALVASPSLVLAALAESAAAPCAIIASALACMAAAEACSATSALAAALVVVPKVVTKSPVFLTKPVSGSSIKSMRLVKVEYSWLSVISPAKTSSNLATSWPVVATCPFTPPLASSLSTPSMLNHFNQKCHVVAGSVTKLVAEPVNSVTTRTSLSLYVGTVAFGARIFPNTRVRIWPLPSV